jgi:two-component system chemotaxis response regulator CheY
MQLERDDSGRTRQMNASATNNGADGMTLPAILDLGAAEDFLASMRQRLQDGGPLAIDASDSETLTYPCIQILLAAMNTYDGVSIVKPSRAFVSAFEDLSLDWKQTQANGEDFGNIEQGLSDQGLTENAADTEDTENEISSLTIDQPNNGAATMRILTIDDSKTMRDMLMLTLVEAGFDVLQAVDGQDGLDVLAKSAVDIIITDINMPKMDGYEVIRQVRANPEYQKMPILVLTTESETEKKNIARKIGATGWLVKPFDPDQLVATVRKVAPTELRAG